MTEPRQHRTVPVEPWDNVARRVWRTSTTLRRVLHTWLADLAAAEPIQPVSGLFGRRGGAGRHGWLSVKVDPDSARRLAEWAGRPPVRALALVAAAGGIVTGRYASRDDLLVRTLGSGAFSAPLVPLWLDAVPDETVAALLDRVVLTAGDALTAASVLSQQESAEILARHSGAIVVAAGPYRQPPENVELACVATVRDGRFGVRLRFDRDAVGESLARTLAGHLAVVLRTFAGAPRTPVAEVDILSTEERARILGTLCNAEPVLSPQVLLYDRVREYAGTVPDRAAVVYRDRTVTYAELDRAARALADRLAGLGVAVGDRVALLLDRSDLPVVAVLGCFALGAVYVPVDTRHPDDRLRFMLADCAARAMVTEPALRDRVPADFTGPVLVIADPHELAVQEAPERAGPGADAPAYAIYTSGTTGTPKAVLVSHGAFAATCASYSDCYGWRAEPPVCLQLGSFAFDVFNGDLGRSLYAAGTLVVCPDEVRAEIDGIVDLIAEHRVTIMESTPALVNPLSEALARVPEALAHLDVLVSSADGWRGQDYLAVRKLLDEHVRLYNVYGVTEAAIDQTYYPPEEHDGADLPYVPIGRPLRHVSVYVVDHRMRLQPAGVPGELCVGGAGVAMGYLGRDELTAERFRPDPFGRSARLYRTGDLVRFRSDGDLEFLGRVDHQVKIRGFRIELGEVESVLREHPGIREVVADARDDGAGTQRLVAYLVPNGHLPSATELCEFCGRFLPVYMVPSVFVGVAELPLSGNGKVVRELLPDPGVGRVGVGVEFAEARSEVERVVAGVWGEVLGVDRVGVFDDFFVLGGHSLLAVRVVSRVRELCGVSLGVRVLFEAPTVVGMAEAITATAAPHDVPGPRQETFAPGQLVAASAAQTRLWFTEQLLPGTATNNIPTVLRLRGELNVDALRQALDELVARHEALRTVFEAVDGLPYQRLLPPEPVPLPVIDRSAEADRPTVANLAEVRAVVETPFDLVSGPLLRAAVVRLGPADHVLAIAIHHLVADGWSVGLILAELSTRYTAAQQGAPYEPAGPLWQYRHYARWQAEALTEGVVANHADFWRRHLDGVRDLTLPTDRPRPAQSVGSGAAVPILLPADLVARIDAFAIANGVTPFMVLMATYQVLLARYSGQDRFAVGTVSDGRARTEFEDIVGFFVNTLSVRADLTGRPTFGQHLARVRRNVLDAIAHQDVPFDQVLAKLAPPRTPGVPPIFQVCLALETGSTAAPELGDLDLREEPVQALGSRFDLTLELSRREGTLRGGLTYSTELFDRPTAERMLRCFRVLLDQVLAEPGRPVDDLDILDPADRADIAEFSAGPRRELRLTTLHGAIWQQARRQPSALAVIDGDRRLSFAELTARADALADRLIAAGVGPERVVAILLPRGVDLVIAMLAVLRAGGVYLPVEPDLPDHRIVFMLADSGAALLLTGGDQTARSGVFGMPTFDVADYRPAPAAQGRPGIDPGAAAYVLYTSGSTGQPKAVVIPHAAIDNRLRWMQATYRLKPDDRVLFKTPAGFDVSVWEIFWPLREGVPLVISAPGDHRDPVYLADLIRRERITTVHFVPPMLDYFIRHGDAGCAEALRRVICSGEALPPDLVERFADTFGVPLHNLYGPTEAAVDVTHWPCPARPGARVPIGRPVWNTQVHVLDERLHPVPVGVPGELYLAGVQLARGYLGRPALTAERFVPNPFGGPGARMYRTGDVVRWSVDGQLEYLGRTDQQVKIRGQRIELGEIEHALAGHAGVAAAVVVARPDQRGDHRLVGYLVPDPDAARPVLELLRAEEGGDLAGASRFSLPNGMAMLGRSRAEADFLYQEIFQRREYLAHGMVLPPDAVVFDVGAHVGYFAAFVGRTCPEAEVFAFEPIPDLFRLLAINTAVHGVRTRLFNVGLAKAPGSATFTYYPGLSIMSGRYGEEAAERAVLEAFVSSEMAQAGGSAEDAELLDEVLTERLRHESVHCELRTISDMITTEQVTRIDLLKIDAEKSELDVLLGVADEHWPLIRQVVVEVHDVDERLVAVTALLTRHGFRVTTDTSNALASTGLVNVFAVRTESAASIASVALAAPARTEGLSPWWSDPDVLVEDVRGWLAGRLPVYMVPSVFVGVAELPLSGNGKVVRELLPDPGVGRVGVGVEFVRARSEVERVVAGVWGEVLGVDRVGVFDDFFASGGHSLLAARVVSRVRELCGVSLGVGVLFASPTVAGIAEAITALQQDPHTDQPAPRRYDRSAYRLD